ncbi:hypothetical protein RV11_GL000582 [Enterococcus phoeniculicola]|uniref:Uncharacterized protein n=1 Tax=Enterococcus phoeniculicola ATCC BAA-412 TaxID=1158610 RepID=R3WEK7_9ENTE|nr:replication initiation factor domain-containing protein [Enterococcus phoeniculicola]EOL46306.1 hypothetical protein UC3_01112 [Enterococcus phoeniculicola ATCC BAA-412]EOT76849.1 hypothetical protein I589_01810 [Enterococcus phoeniculicola ATCC BAA-412]OJG71292.1 hypothetical protein RV11_GL000582 [Enterococcus phoeniculicola]
MSNVSINTSKVSNKYITIDWLTASFSLDYDVHEFITEVLQMDYRDFIFEVGGIGRSYHYGNTAKFDNIHIYYSTALDVENGSNSGFAVNFNGQGCRQYEIYRWNENNCWTWYDTIRNLLKISGNFTRLDIALDLINSKYTWQFLLKKIYEKTLIYRGNVKRINKINTKTGEDYNASIYIGDKPQQLNIYDKKGERFDRAKQEYDVDSWTRWELRLSSDKAHLAVLELAEGRELSDLFQGILSAHYRFVTLTGDKNRSRRENARWWTEFLNNASETHLYVSKDKPTLKRKENWLENHGPDKAELMLYLKDYFVYGSNAAHEKLLSRIQLQRQNVTNTDIQLILQGITEEFAENGSVSRYKTSQVVNELHELLYNDI